MLWLNLKTRVVCGRMSPSSVQESTEVTSGQAGGSESGSSDQRTRSNVWLTSSSSPVSSFSSLNFSVLMWISCFSVVFPAGGMNQMRFHPQKQTFLPAWRLLHLAMTITTTNRFKKKGWRLKKGKQNQAALVERCKILVRKSPSAAASSSIHLMDEWIDGKTDS